MEREQTPLTVAVDADGDMGCLRLRGKEVDQRQHLLDFIADDVASELKGHAVDELAVGLVGHADGRVAGPGVRAIDQDGDDDLAAELGETTRELGMRR